MSLKAVEIDPLLLAGLYSQPLIQREGPILRNPVPSARELPFLGDNLQHILLVVRNPDQGFVSEEVFTALTKLLSACKLGMADVALVNLAHLQEVEIARLLQQFQPHKVILFQVDLPGISAGKPKNASWEEAGIQVIHTDTLEAMLKDPGLKKPFWNALKIFFNLNI